MSQNWYSECLLLDTHILACQGHTCWGRCDWLCQYQPTVTLIYPFTVNLGQWNHSQGWCDIILGDFSHMVPMLHAMFRMWMRHWIGIPTSHLQFTVGICAVPMADAVAIGEVSCYNVLDRIRPFTRFTQTIRQCQCSAAQWSLACEG